MLKLDIVEAKEMKIWLDSVDVKKNGEIKKGVKPYKVGTYIELNDGNEVQVRETGEIFHGKGTIIQFNFRHRTISVTSPEYVDHTATGAVKTTSDNQPIWHQKKQTGFTEQQFKQLFGKRLVELAYAGHNRALDEAA